MILGPQAWSTTPLALCYLWTSVSLESPWGLRVTLWVQTSLHTFLAQDSIPMEQIRIWGIPHPAREVQVCARRVRVAQPGLLCPLGYLLLFVSVARFQPRTGTRNLLSLVVLARPPGIGVEKWIRARERMSKT